MDINELVLIIGNFGFPVAVTSYLLIRLEKQIIHMTESMTKLSDIISLGFINK